ncbi:MAG: tRNA-dependent cyclodipeptide synthase [Okeania sp. SIO3B5]|uniref:tRNA-dependent cyclodipeptide synthase n=1 Tax=Okeania sp. SIO3B5 TaxID=2607811 RepID=UPI0013FED8E5|nr:tRNA-dependent cyclodipeptide synthase [Okeania sp. SIO3B5]NEO54088.1 tRNA-dependent cyclodipeptide synthase [Okeania sp. SIO3B5]
MNSYRDQETIIENFDWNQLSLEQLKLIQSKICKAIDIKKQDLNLTQIQEYKASLAKVFPTRIRSSLSDYQKCVLLTSLGSKHFLNPKRIEACIKWISKNFQTCVVLVSDSIYRLTIQVTQELKEDEALFEAIQTGEKFINENSYLFDQYSQNCKFEFQKASQIEKQSEFEIYYQNFQHLYQKDQSFQNMVNSFAQIYLNRNEQMKAENKQKDYNKEKMYLGTTYLLEESALLTCLAKQGCSVLVYPGSIKIFEEISEGLHPEVPLPLKQMVWVSLRFKKRTVKMEL